MAIPTKYNYELLKNFCLEKSIKLSCDYSKDNILGSTIINFYCSNCNKENFKRFDYLIKRNSLCKRCVTIQSFAKQKATMLEKYGVEHPSQSQFIKDKIKNIFIAKYGVDNPAKLQEIKDKQRNTNLQKYGVEYIIHNKESKDKMLKTNLEKYGAKCCLENKEIQEKIKNTNIEKYGIENVGCKHEFHEKMKKTNLKKYGVNYPLQNIEIYNKMEETCLEKYGVKSSLLNVEIKNKANKTIQEKYGVEYPSQNKEIKDKIIETNIKKFGYKNPMQNEEIAQKSSNNCYKTKLYIFPSGKEIKCQGYEPFALDELNKIYCEENIITGCKNVPTIWYNDVTGKKRRHYIDIFISSKNKCIEVKSIWTLKKKNSNIFEKQNAAKEMGYEYEIWVYNCKGNKVETFV